MQATKKADIYGGATPAAGRGEPAAVASVVVAELCTAPSSAAAAALAAAGAVISMLNFSLFCQAPSGSVASPSNTSSAAASAGGAFNRSGRCCG